LSGEPDFEAYLAGVEPADIIHLLNEAVGLFIAVAICPPLGVVPHNAID